MVGGKIIEIVKESPDRWWVNCGGIRSEYKTTCAIFLDPAGNDLAPGDSLWWQSDSAYWTPYTRGKFDGREDVKLKKIGFSGVNRPALP